jgi:hypothetical protein
MKRIVTTVRAVGCAVLLACSMAKADGLDALTTKLPEGANAIVAADVGFLRASPQAGQIRWVARGGESGATALLPSIPGIKHLCLAAHVDIDSVRPDWQLALLEVSSMPSLQQIAQSQGGYLDTISGAQAAWSRSGACYLALDGQTLVTAQPVGRQMVARWIADTRSPAGLRSSVYLREAASAVSTQTPIVLALDLRDAFALPAVLGWLRLQSNDEVAKAATDPVAIANLLAKARGVTIKLNVGEATTATAKVDFDADTTPLAPLARPLLLEVLSDHGLAIPDIKQWSFAASGRTVTAQGPLSDQGLRQLLSVLQAPAPQMAAGGATGEPPTAASPSGNSSSMATGSYAYYQQVSSVLDGIGMGSSLGEQSGWLWRNAKRIDQLAATNVDPDLLKWGASVSANLRQAASILDAGQQQVTAAAQSAQAPVGAYSTGDYDNGDQQRAQYRAALENYRRQNQRAAAQIRSQVTQEANKPIQAALDSRGQIRATMASRYGGQFQ